jgi:hypothetical protein
MEALKKSLAEKQAPAAASAAAPVGKKPPARALQPVPVAQKKGKKVAG